MKRELKYIEKLETFEKLWRLTHGSSNKPSIRNYLEYRNNLDLIFGYLSEVWGILRYLLCGFLVYLALVGLWR